MKQMNILPTMYPTWLLCICVKTKSIILALLATLSCCAAPDSSQYFLNDCTIPTAAANVPAKLADTGCFSTAGAPAAALLEYTVNAPLYADGASKRRWMKTSAVASWDANGVLQPEAGSGLFKEFSVDGVRLETRLLMRDAQGNWLGYSYAWSNDQSTATLLPEGGGSGSVVGHPWTFPSRQDCLTCHNSTAERVLGPRQPQLNLMLPALAIDGYELAAENQLTPPAGRRRGPSRGAPSGRLARSHWQRPAGAARACLSCGQLRALPSARRGKWNQHGFSL